MSLRSLYMKFYVIKNWPRRALIYYRSCIYFLKHYPKMTPPHASRTDRGPVYDKARKQQMFRFVFQNMLNQARTTEWQLRYHVGVDRHARRPDSRSERTEYKAWQQDTYIGEEWHTAIMHRSRDFVSLPEGVLLRELRRLGDWLPPSSRHKRRKKKRNTW